MRIDGYAPIEEYALIGDGRTAALVARDGSIDWLCLPNFDSPSVFAAIVDAERGGSFELQPAIDFDATRRYLPNTNVLETTFATDRGSVRVIDALTLPDRHLEPMRELIRSVEGLSGTVPMRWRVAPRFHYGAGPFSAEWRGNIPVASCAAEALAIPTWNAGRPMWQDDRVVGTFDLRQGEHALLAAIASYAEPLVFPPRREVEARLAATIAFWQQWAPGRAIEGPWRDHVVRSALVLKALIFAPSGANVAAPTTSLPEAIGGERNWDYRFCWIRDSNFIIDALMELGAYDEAQSLFWWFMQATALTEPEVHVLYRLDGGLGIRERAIGLAGYRRSRPVRIGNGAVGQTQLDIYGDLLESAWLYSHGPHRIDADTGEVLARIADHVCDVWRQQDSGIWEVRNGPFHFTHSKVMCWVALDRACRLAERGALPARHAVRWRREADAVRAFIEERCWSDRLRSYTRTAGSSDVDASLLVMALLHYADPKGARIGGTIDARPARRRFCLPLPRRRRRAGG
jgi:GH15 family glucan-1,4-alpha-glucosidase